MKVKLVVTFFLFSEAIGIKPSPVFVTDPRGSDETTPRDVRVISKLRARLY
jgi:hypothetical protein